MATIARPAPALPADAQAVCNHAFRLGLRPLVQDAISDPEDPDAGTAVEVTLLHGFDTLQDTGDWTLLVDPDDQYPLTLLGPAQDDNPAGSWTGLDQIRAALDQYETPRPRDPHEALDARGHLSVMRTWLTEHVITAPECGETPADWADLLLASDVEVLAAVRRSYWGGVNAFIRDHPLSAAA